MKVLNLPVFLTIIFSFLGREIVLAQSSSNTEEIQTKWLSNLSEGKDLKTFYTKNSGILLNDELYIGSVKIKTQLKEWLGADTFLSFKTQETHQLRDQQKFEAGEYITASGKRYQTIVGWSKKEKWTKEFEVIYENTVETETDSTIVDEGRDQWVKHSNEHRPDLIAMNVFSTRGMYFHRGKISPQNEIANAYSYMTRESYQITLEPLMVRLVDDSTVFEIGIFRTGGQGLYTLIWVKEGDEWKLLLDFNF